VTAIVSSSFDDAPMVLPDNSAIYFLSGRDGSAHIYRSVRSNNTWQAPALASGTDLNNSNNDYPTIVANDLTIYFLSSRAGGVAGTDNWKATRASAVQSFGAATNVTSYQWLRESTEIPGATLAELSLRAVGPLDAGNYTVRGTAGGRTLSARSVRLNVVPQGRPDAIDPDFEYALPTAREIPRSVYAEARWTF
jgi:hypothetical protein